LIKSLQKGNLQMAIFMVQGKDRKMLIEANPQFKTINCYETEQVDFERTGIAPKCAGAELSPAALNEDTGVAEPAGQEEGSVAPGIMDAKEGNPSFKRRKRRRIFSPKTLK
jgi:hypothetical protein